MKPIQIRPAIDLMSGKCVRLEKGNFEKPTIYADDPLDQALYFQDLGCKFLHLVDLDGARIGQMKQYRVLEKLASKTSLKIDYGGGIYTNEDVSIAFNAGAAQITAGSIAVKNPELVLDWMDSFGPDKIILGMDVMNEVIMTKGWQEAESVHWRDFIGKFLRKGLKYCISTEISRDGMMTGPSFEWYDSLKSSFSDLNLIASGGVGNIDDLVQLNEAGIYGVIVGKALYEKSITDRELTEFILKSPQ